MTLTTDTLWFEVAVMTGVFAVGQIFFKNFAARTPNWQRLLKLVFFTALACTVSATFGRAWFFVLLGLLASAVLFIHALYLPLHGVNGLTGEPKAKYGARRPPKTENP